MPLSSRLGAGLATLAVTACASAALAPAAQAAPGNPGTPSDPSVVFREGFENALNDGQLVGLRNYVPTADKGTTYTADPFWLEAAAGNGLVIDGTTSDGTFAAATYTNADGAADLRELATTLGRLNGSAVPAANHVVSAYTDANGPDGAVEFRTVDPVDLEADGRFLTISANVAAVNCVRAAAPQLVFLLDDGGTESAVNPTPLNPCVGAPSDAAYSTTIRGGNAVLFDGDEVGIVLRNAAGTGGGNDHAFDDLRVLDVTPQLDKQFQDEGPLAPGDVTDLVLTVTNTSELGVKTGWEFTDALPEGLAVAGDAVSTCAAADITAAEGDEEIVVEDGSLAAGAASCSITVPVTSDRGGVFENSADNITSRGLDAPGATQVEYVAAEDPADPPAEAPADQVLPPATGAERASMVPAAAALAAGAALLGGLGLRRMRRQD
jgi:uncharacterized repeat protein (TIGR01451 family)